MHERGVRFVTGLDMGMAYAEFDSSSANARAFVKWLGFSEWEALAAGTKDTAQALRLESIDIASHRHLPGPPPYLARVTSVIVAGRP